MELSVHSMVELLNPQDQMQHQAARIMVVSYYLSLVNIVCILYISFLFIYFFTFCGCFCLEIKATCNLYIRCENIHDEVD